MNSFLEGLGFFAEHILRVLSVIVFLGRKKALLGMGVSNDWWVYVDVVKDGIILEGWGGFFFKAKVGG